MYVPQSSATTCMISTSRGYERPRPQRVKPSLLYTRPAMSLYMALKRQRTRRHLCRCPERVLRESCSWATISRMPHSQSSSRMAPSQPLSHLDPEQQFTIHLASLNLEKIWLCKVLNPFVRFLPSRCSPALLLPARRPRGLCRWLERHPWAGTAGTTLPRG